MNAPSGFVMQVMVSLESSLAEVGDLLVDNG